MSNEVGSANWWAGNVYDSVSRWCVPVFVMISGALLLNPRRHEAAGVFYRKRLVRLFMPILFWSLVFLAWNAVRDHVAGRPVDVSQLVLSLVSGLPHYHMWFLYMIIGLYLVTPALRMIMAEVSDGFLVVLIAFVFAIAAIHAFWQPSHILSAPFFIWFLPYTSYYLLGGLLSRYQRNFNNSAWLALFAVSVMATALGCYALALRRGLDAGLYTYGYFSVTVIPMSIATIFLLINTGKHQVISALGRKLAPYTLGIYLFHPLVLEPLRVFGLGAKSSAAWVTIPLVAGFVYASSLLAAWIISRTPYLRSVI